jgi:hypothetical protein
MKQLSLKKDIKKLQSDLLDFEHTFNQFSAEIEIREQRWKNCEKKIEEINRINEGTCTLNIGGKNYEVSLYTLKSRRGTIFYKQILRGEIKKDTMTFYDRDPTFFPVILNFLRTGKLKAEKLNDEQKEDLLNEAQFYEVNYIIETLKATPQEVEYSSFESSGQYNYSGRNVGTESHKDLKDKSLTKGICAQAPGRITLTFTREVEFDEIEIAGYNGDSTGWYVGNGRSATIQASTDKIAWTNIGTIPPEFGAAVLPVKVTKTKAKHIRFDHTDLLGIGYLNIKEMKKK